MFVAATGYYFAGTLVYTPATGAPRRLRMAMGIRAYGEAVARTERLAPGQSPFRTWCGFARPELETGPLADAFLTAPLGERPTPADPANFFGIYPVPGGVVAAGLLQPVDNPYRRVPQLGVGQLNFRLGNHRITGGGTDPDGATYAFDLREQAAEPRFRPGDFPVLGPVDTFASYMEGELIVTQPDGQVERLPATGGVTNGDGRIFIQVPALTGSVASTAFGGPTAYTELRTPGGGRHFAIPFGQESDGFLRVAPGLRERLPGVKKIGVVVRYGRLTGGCVADDGVAYSFVLTQVPPLGSVPPP